MAITWILLISFLLKAPFLNMPLVGHFGSYQSMIAMMSRHMVTGGWEAILFPEVSVLMNGAPAQHLTYYPFCALVAAIPFGVIGGSLDFWGRFQAALSMAGAGFFVFKIANQLFNRKIALWATILFSFSPMILVSGISFQNEAIAVFFICASFYFWIQKSSSSAILSGLLMAAALLSRIHFILILPAFAFQNWFLTQESRVKRSTLFLIATFLPVCFWFYLTYLAVQDHPERIFTSLFGQMGESRVLAMSHFSQLSTYISFAKTIGLYWITPIFIPFCFLSFVKPSKQIISLGIWLLGCLALLLLLPRKVLDHPFYIIAAMPVVSILAAIPLSEWTQKIPKWSRYIAYTLSLALVLRVYLPPAYSAELQNKSYLKEIGQFVQEKTAADDLIIAQHETSPDLLYYCDRLGWTFNLAMHGQALDLSQPRLKKMMEKGYGNPIKWLEDLRQQGAKYLVISQKEKFNQLNTFADYVRNQFELISDNQQNFLLYKLNP